MNDKKAACGRPFLCPVGEGFSFVSDGVLSFLAKEGSSAPAGAGSLRRVTFANSGKSNQKRHSRGKEVSIFLPP